MTTTTRKTTYVLFSAKGNHGEVIGRVAAIEEARRLRDTLRPSYGVDVARKHDSVVIYTAR
jgi:hypothetical protein